MYQLAQAWASASQKVWAGLAQLDDKLKLWAWLGQDQIYLGIWAELDSGFEGSGISS